MIVAEPCQRPLLDSAVRDQRDNNLSVSRIEERKSLQLPRREASGVSPTRLHESGYFAIGLPSAGIAKETLYLGSVSKFDDADKVTKSGVTLVEVPDSVIPMVEGCVAWAIFKVIPEVHNEKSYDLFIGEAVAAWADSRVFSDGHWHFEKADDLLRTLHYVAGGHFYKIGEAIHVA